MHGELFEVASGFFLQTVPERAKQELLSNQWFGLMDSVIN